MTNSDHALDERLERVDLESVPQFRLARLLIVFDEAAVHKTKLDTIDRIGYFEFFSSNPYAVIEEDKSAARDRLRLALAGLDAGQLSYSSVGHRFVSRRRLLQNDLAHLFALGFLEIVDDGYSLSAEGTAAARSIRSVYADGLRAGAKVVSDRLGGLSRKQLNQAAERALGKSWLLLDFLDDVREVVVYLGSQEGEDA